MLTRVSYGSFAEMPLALQDFLFSQEFAEADGVLQNSYHLTDEQRTLLGDKVMDAIFNDVTLVQAALDLRAAFMPTPVAEEKWTSFLADLLKLEVWPLRELFGEELTTLLAENKISATGWPAMRVILKPLTYGGAASEIANTVGFNLLGGQLRERLRDLIVSKVKGVRIDSQIKEALTRSADFGGIGLDSAMADKTLAVLNDLLGSARILSEDEYADWLSEESQRSKVKGQKLQSSSSKEMHEARFTTREEEAEIDAMKAKLSAAPRSPTTVLDQAVEAIWSTVPDTPTVEYLANRLRYIISSRLRDVRSAFELTQLLARDIKIGGLGLAEPSAEALAHTIEEGYKTFHDTIMEEEKKKLVEQMEEQKRKIEERKRREAEEHARWYREKILAKQQGEEAQKQLAERLKATLMHPMDVKEKKVEVEKFGELVAPSLAAPKIVGAQGHAAAPEVKISKATLELSAAATAVRPKLEDVKAGPRLMGPIQEIASLTLAEFRRLAKDPAEAAEKILQKVETLGKESRERRMEGIQVWRASPLQQTYLKLIAASFASGKMITALAEEKRAAGEDAPSPSELSAILMLNSKLHL